MTHDFISKGTELLMILPVEMTMNFYPLVCVPGEPWIYSFLFPTPLCSSNLISSPYWRLTIPSNTTKTFFSALGAWKAQNVGGNYNFRFGGISFVFPCGNIPPLRGNVAYWFEGMARNINRLFRFQLHHLTTFFALSFLMCKMWTIYYLLWELLWWLSELFQVNHIEPCQAPECLFNISYYPWALSKQSTVIRAGNKEQWR